jgi:hypothetical protein
VPGWRDNDARLRPRRRSVAGLGGLTPHSGSRHYRARIRGDLPRRIAKGGRDAKELQSVLERLDRLIREPPT